MTLIVDPAARSELHAPTEQEVAELDAWWRASMYLTVGQIYLRDNALLREPLRDVGDVGHDGEGGVGVVGGLTVSWSSHCHIPSP